MTEETKDEGPAQDQPEPDAQQQADQWQVVIGIRAMTDPANPSNMTGGLLFDLKADHSVIVHGKHGPVPDKTNEAVHFAQWFDRNKEHLVALWRTEYGQYMNLRMMTDRGVPGMRIVDASGKQLQ